MIDVHAHLFLRKLLGMAGSYGPELEQTGPGTADLVTGAMRWPVGDPATFGISAAERVEALNAAGIDLQVVSMSPLWLFHHAPTDVATSFARAANDGLAAWCGETGGRALPLAQLPTQDPAAAADELLRAVRDLGAVGAYIGSDARLGLDDPDLDEVYSACEELDVPLFVHATVPGVDGPPGDGRLDRWLGHVVLGYPIEDTLATQTFLFSDVLDRHPRLDVCISHGGGATGMLWGRLNAYASSPASPATPEQLRARMRRLWFDNHLHDARAADLLTAVVDPEHLVFGSNFGGWDSESTAGAAGGGLDAHARRLLRLHVPVAG